MEDLGKQQHENWEAYAGRLQDAVEGFAARAQITDAKLQALEASIDSQFGTLAEDNQRLERELSSAKSRLSEGSHEEKAQDWWRDIAHKAEARADLMQGKLLTVERALMQAVAIGEKWEELYRAAKEDRQDQTSLADFLKNMKGS